MLHYFGILRPPAAKEDTRQTACFGPEPDTIEPGPEDWRLSRAESDAALFSGREPPDWEELFAGPPRFVTMMLPPHY